MLTVVTLRATLMLSLSTSHRWRLRMKGKLAILITVCAAVLAINLDTTIVNVALPTISDKLDAGTRQLQWIVDGYNLAFAGARAGRRQPLGPVRSPARADHRAGRLRRGERGRRDRHRRRRARRGTLRDGRLRGADLPDHALDHQQHLPRAPRARRRARASGVPSSASASPPVRSSVGCCSSTSPGAASSGRWSRWPWSPRSPPTSWCRSRATPACRGSTCPGSSSRW